MILYFSGTGNSRYVARMLAAEFGEECRPITPAMRGTVIELSAADRHLVWVFPVYSWGVPPFVRSLMGSVVVSRPVLMHAVMTCGDDCGRADRMWRREAGHCGWATGAVCTVQMPNNYVAMKGFDVDPTDVEARKLADAPERVAVVASLIGHSDDGGGEITDVVSGSWPWLKTAIVYPWFVRNAMSPRRFHTADTCIGCGRCAQVCPCANITIDSTTRRPTWGSDCAGCLACYHICPTHAVAYGRATHHKGQYQYFLKQSDTDNRPSIGK